MTAQPIEKQNQDDAIVAGPLTADQRQARDNVVASSRMEGMNPTQIEVDALGEVAAGRLSAEEAIRRATLAVTRRAITL